MWFLAIAVGIVVAIAAGLLAGPARRAGRPAVACAVFAVRRAQRHRRSNA